MLYILSEMFCLQKGEDTRAGKMEDLSKKEKKKSAISSDIVPHVLLDSLVKVCQIPVN